MKYVIMIAAMPAVTGCEVRSSGPPTVTGYRAKGQTQERANADAAACRNEARATFNGTYPFWDIYADCMVAKGYDVSW